MIGKKLSDRYEVISELGRGGMGVVYRAKDPRLNREVAVKLIPPAMLTPEGEKRFETEAQVVAQMDHPSIVSIYDYGHHDGSLFFVMPVVEGKSLRQLTREQDLTLGEVLDVGTQVAEALDYSHSRGVIHRDIKPENVMVTQDAGCLRVRVMDFGLARDTRETRMTKTGMLLGTVSYLSPEQVRGGAAIDARTDIYALGTMLYECVSSQLPFTGEMQAILYRVVHELPQTPRERGVDIDDELETIIMGCLAKEPENRPQDAKHLARALRGYRTKVHDSERIKGVMATRTIAVPRPAVSPFIGRQAEMKELQQRLNAAIAGECQFVVVSGEPGVGKTRLLDELENLARAREIRVLHGRVVEQDGAFPYHGFCEVIQEFFRQKEFSSSSTGMSLDLSDVSDDLMSLFPMLGEIEPIRSSASGHADLAQATESRTAESRTQIFELLARTLAKMACGKPLVLILEDLHGAEASLEALQYIVRRLGPTPTLIVGTYRSTEIDRSHPVTRILEGFAGDRRFAALPLAPLSQSEHRELLGTLVGGSEVLDELAVKLYEGSEGNPYFAKELVRSLLDAGNIVQDEAGAWTLPGGGEISAEALPATIQQAVEKRVERLPDTLRTVLAVAAVMGKEFEFDDLEKLLPDADDLEDATDKLIQEGLLEEDRRSRADRLAFTSGVVREVLYAELSRRKRRSLHRKYARLVEKRHTGRLERVYPQLVYHFSAADEPEKTVEYGLLHARKSLDAFSPEEAVRSAKTALEFLDDEWEGDRAQEGQARMMLAAAHQMSGDTAGALREIEQAIDVFEREKKAAETVSALLLAAKTAWQARKTREARQWVERGIDAARATDDSDCLVQLLGLGGTLAQLGGDYPQATSYRAEAEQLRPGSRDGRGQEEIPRGGRLKVAMANLVVAPEPAASYLVEETEVFANVFETLLTTDPAGNQVPLLCERWEASEGGRSFLMKLRPNVRFHDGHVMTAVDVKASFERSVREVTRDVAEAFSPICGLAAFIEGKSDELPGIIARSDQELEFRLEEPLPIYPALLTDHRSAVTRQVRVETGPSRLVGTGPFRLAARDTERVTLEPNHEYWAGAGPRLDAIEFRYGLSPSDIASGFDDATYDLARDLPPRELEKLLRDPRLRSGVMETSQKLTYFLMFNCVSSDLGRNAELRRALAGTLRLSDLVWQTLGQFAQPATSLIPPGILGHDPGRRGRTLAPEEARETLRSAGLPEKIRLKGLIHPLIIERHGALLDAIFSIWKELGVEVVADTMDIGTFLDKEGDPAFDFEVTRWGADYDDPDNFTHTLFNSETGEHRLYCVTAEGEQIAEQARAETDPSVREGLYRKFERVISDSGMVIPLFYAVSYHVANARVRGAKLSSVPPYLNYAALGKTEAVTPVVDSMVGGGIVNVPMSGVLKSLDPAISDAVEQGEVNPAIYEGLTRDVGGGQIEPWLASEFRIGDSGKKYHFQLREGVRFHDGRRLGVRDVRFSLERMLQSPESQSRRLYSFITGAHALLDGKASELKGFHIHSASEFTIELDQPVAFFPGLTAYVTASIVPEGTHRIGTSWRDGAVGTGPFRATRFEPGRLLELERHFDYWRPGYPKSDGLVFNFEISPKEILSGFRKGRFSLASDLYPADVEALRRDSDYASGFRDIPRLSTYFVAFNRLKGPLEDEALRKRINGALDRDLLVRQTLGRLATPADGLIPPGLLGHEAARRQAVGNGGHEPSSPVELSAAIHPIFNGEYSAFFEKLTDRLREVGVTLRRETESIAAYLEAVEKGAVEIALGRWIADYPDPDTFFHVLHSSDGNYGKMAGSGEVDELIERGRVETDPESRHAIYRQLEQTIRKQTTLVPLFHEQVYRFARPEVEGLALSYWTPTVAYEKLRVRPEGRR